MRILILLLLTSCAGTSQYQSTNLLLNVPRMHTEMMEKEIRIRECLKAGTCYSKWDPEIQTFVIHYK